MDDNGSNASGGDTGAHVAGRWHSVSQIRWPEPPAAPVKTATPVAAPPVAEPAAAAPAPPAAPSRPVEKPVENTAPAPVAAPPPPAPSAPPPFAPPFAPAPPVVPGPPFAPFPPAPAQPVPSAAVEETEKHGGSRLGLLAWIGAAVLLALLAVGIGMLIRQGEVNKQRDRADTAERQIGALAAANKEQDQKIAALQSQLNARSVVIAGQNRRLASLTAQQAAAKKQQATLDRRKTQLDQREAALNDRAAQLDQQQSQTTVTQPPAVVQSLSFSDGLFEVGVDIPPGQYHTEGGATCYWATLTNSDSNSIVNDNSSPGPQTITIDTPYFASDGCGTWTKVG